MARRIVEHQAVGGFLFHQQEQASFSMMAATVTLRFQGVCMGSEHRGLPAEAFTSCCAWIATFAGVSRKLFTCRSRPASSSLTWLPAMGGGGASADWTCHLRTGIAQTSGLKENLLHLLMFTEIGVGIEAVVLLESSMPQC